MARAINMGDPIMAFRFSAEFFARIRGEDEQDRRTTEFKRLNEKLGFTSVGVSSRGFEVWRGLFHDEPSIFSIIGEADVVECIAFGRPNQPVKSGETVEVRAKIFRFTLDGPAVHMPMAIEPMLAGTTITQERGLSAISSAIVMEGVLWPGWSVASITDKVLPLPG